MINGLASVANNKYIFAARFGARREFIDIGLRSITGMTTYTKIRVIPSILVLMFSFSNIGLPLAILACPTPSRASDPMACCESEMPDCGVGLSSSSTMDCCALTQGSGPVKFESPELYSASNTQTKFKTTYSILPFTVSSLPPIHHASIAASLGITFHPRVESYLFFSSLRI
jgi:hypothetical protein